MITMEKLNLIKNFKLITDIYDRNYECCCGKSLSLLDLYYGDVGESFKCSCGEHYLLANDDEIKVLEEYSYSYQEVFIITKDVFFVEVDLDNKYIINKKIKKTTEQVFLDLREENGKKTLDIYYFDCTTNKITTKNKSFFNRFGVNEFQRFIDSLKEICIEHNIKPNYGELFQEFCKFENMFNYEKFFKILFTEYFVELFVKSGLGYLINTNVMLSRDIIKRSLDINYSANNMSKALRIPKKSIKFIGDKKYSVSKISIIQDFFRDRNFSEFKVLIMDQESIFIIEDLSRLRSLLNNGYNPEKLSRYVKVICKEERLSISTVLMLLDDAFRMSRDLEVDFRPYSKNLKARHDRLQEQYMIVKNDIDAKRLKEVAESLKIKQVGDTYFAKALATIEDFRYEGEGQRNCVLSYISRVAKSEIAIIAIRKRENLEKTFVTVELKRDRIVQAKGFANSSIDSETSAYLGELALKNNWRITSNI